MTPGPKIDGPLVREAVPPRPPDPPRWRRYYLPQTTDASTFVVKGVTLRIAGVAAVPANATCTMGDGREWPCGRNALFAFRRFLHGRAVECLLPYVPDATDVTAPCRIGRIDLALWLLEQGWAKPDALATPTYRAATLSAQCAGAGLWRGTNKPDICPPS
jgi:endonuclease YncB( thermonuclease family)